ncbi:MAG: hypothetical protein K6T81_07670, partial [Alicyclobacillus macrosporangiidus]|nr:hypothetical protein [Alicyclobacillus macrosporangiidus]
MREPSRLQQFGHRWTAGCLTVVSMLMLASCATASATPSVAPDSRGASAQHAGNTQNRAQSAPAMPPSPGAAPTGSASAWIADPDRYAPAPSQGGQAFAGVSAGTAGSPAGSVTNPGAGPGAPPSVPILEYHEANHVPGDPATLKPGELEAQLKWLHDHGFH